MSSSFWVEVEPPVVEDVLAQLGRDVRWAHGDLDTLRGAWPARSLLLYERGVSSRGVEVTYSPPRMQVRLLALSSPADYDLAFRLLEVLGGMVEPEDGEPTPADRAREVFGDAWMRRDMATSESALRAALEAGNTVTVTGPVNALELTPVALRATTPLHELLRRAQAGVADGDDGAITHRDERDGLAVLVDGERVEAYQGPIATRALALLALGPDSIAARTRDLPRADGVDYATVDAGWVADLGRRALVVYQGTGTGTGALPSLERWSGFAITRAESVDALAAYLADHGVALPPRPSRTGDDEPPGWYAFQHTLQLGAAEHAAKLRLRDQAVPVRPPPARAGALELVLFLLAFLVAVVPALVVRLLSWPFRGALRRRAESVRTRRILRWRAAVLAADAARRDATDDVDLLHARAMTLAAGAEWLAAERDLETCVARLTDGATAKITGGAALHDLALARERCGYRALAETTYAEARAAGFTRPATSNARRVLSLPARVAAMFFTISGLAG